MIIKEPVGPWYNNVVHYRESGRPYCRSPVDYSLVEMSNALWEVTCSKCVKDALST